MKKKIVKIEAFQLNRFFQLIVYRFICPLSLRRYIANVVVHWHSVIYDGGGGYLCVLTQTTNPTISSKQMRERESAAKEKKNSWKTTKAR